MPTAVTITVGNSGKDYSTLNAATAGSEVIDRVTNDEVITIECYNTNNVAITSTSASIAAGDAVNNVTIQPAPGEDYAANDYSSKALKYDPADGVAFIVDGAFGTALLLNGASYTEVNNIMFLSDAHITTTIYGNSDSSNINGCILQEESNAARTNRVNYTNCLFIRNANLGVATLTSQFDALNQCTFVCPDDLTSTTHAVGLHSTDIQNCAVFGFSSSTSGSADGTSEYNATDNASIAGTNSLVSQTYADQFKDVNDATQDWGMKAGNDLDGAGAGGIDIGYRIPTAIPGGGGSTSSNDEFYITLLSGAAV